MPLNADAEFHAGRAQNDLRPEHIEKIASTFERYEEVTAYGLPHEKWTRG
jgi:type I restriction enzyme M protein